MPQSSDLQPAENGGRLTCYKGQYTSLVTMINRKYLYKEELIFLAGRANLKLNARRQRYIKLTFTCWLLLPIDSELFPESESC